MTSNIRPTACTCAALLATLWLATIPQSGAAKDKDYGNPTVRPVRAIITELGDSGVSGYVTFSRAGSLVVVRGAISGLEPGKHGMHVHEGTSCDEPGTHYNPTSTPHGSPDQPEELRHVGDLGNLVALDDGVALYERVDPILTLRGGQSIVGHVVIVHSGEDDYITQPSGNSGTPVACGVIRRVWD